MSDQKDEPVIVIDKTGESVTIRLAVPEDLEAVREHIADHTGTGSGNKKGDVTEGDEFMLKEFTTDVANPNITVLFAETTADKIALGIFAVVWASETESYWQSLRVAPAARQRGLAGLLFGHATRLAVARQGPESISRWGVVSSNQIMVDWSTRKGLHGPQPFRRHSAPASEGPADGAELPPGYELRPISDADVDTVMAAFPSFVISKSEFGTQNFVDSGWAEFSESVLRKWMSGKMASPSFTSVQPRQLVDASGAVVGLACLAKAQFGSMSVLFHGYADAATPEAVRLLLHALPAVAYAEGAQIAGGYSPVIDWTEELFEKSTVFTRMTATDQLEFHWRNADFIEGLAV